jgi:hypothetical protein
MSLVKPLTDKQEPRYRRSTDALGPDISPCRDLSYSYSMPIYDIKALGELIFERITAESASAVVVVPLYNYGMFLKECLESVVNQDLAQLSLIVIDDCSTDDSCDVAEKLIGKYAGRFTVTRLIRHRRNQGPSMARNTGIVWSDEPFLFMLDPDNRIRSPALSRLMEAISNSGAVFSYSQLYRFGTSVGVGSGDIWSLERLRAGPYIDMMALINRKALVEAGGFVPLADDISWEDHDLWCRFAELGYRGVFVPELLCEYRFHEEARGRATNPDVDAVLSAEIALRHPALFNRQIAGMGHVDSIALNQPIHADAGGGATNTPADADRDHGVLAGSITSGERASTTFPQNQAMMQPAPGAIVRTEKIYELGAGVIDRQAPAQNNYSTEDKVLPPIPPNNEPALSDINEAISLRPLPLKDQAEILRGSPLFDANWYLSMYPDVARSGGDPALHYLQWGACEGRNPSSYFETKSYMNAFPELKPIDVNPLLHAIARQRSVSTPDLTQLCHISSRGSIAVVLHLFDPDLWEEMRQAIEYVLHPFDLFVSVTRGFSEHMRSAIQQVFPHAHVITFEDHGRDVGAFVALLRSGVLFKYDFVCKIHTKRSPHRPDGDNWRRTLISGVLGSSDLVDRIVANFRADPALGMVVAHGYLWSGPEPWSRNERWLNRLLPRLGFPPEVNHCTFPAGNIFWMRSSLLHPLLRLGIDLSDFEPEPLFIDGGLAHAVERIFGLICHYGSMRAIQHSDLLDLPQTVIRARITTSASRLEIIR